jgi:hypothetical protein
MSVSGFAFLDAEMVVVNVIGGELDEKQLAQFERDYAALFGAEFSVPVLENVAVWIGGKYDPETGEFSPPAEGVNNDTLPG